MELIHADGTALNGLPFDTVVAGPLCESGDVFTQEKVAWCCTGPCRRRRWEICWCCTTPVRMAPPCRQTTNARPLIAEVLMENGEPRLIRRRQTVAELLALEAV